MRLRNGQKRLAIQMRARCDVLFNRAVQRNSQRAQALERCDVSFTIGVGELQYCCSAINDRSRDFARTLFGVRQVGERFAFACAADIVLRVRLPYALRRPLTREIP